MENKTDLPIPRLLTLAEDVADGLAVHGATVGITRNTEPVVRFDLDTAELARDIYEAGAQALRDKNAELRMVAIGGRQFVRLTRDVLIPVLGSRYTAAWNQTGLIGSLKIPTKREVLQGVLQSKRSFLTNNPGLEVGDKVTATIAGVHLNALSDGRSAVLVQETAVQNLKIARDAKVVLLQKRLRLFKAELGEKVGPLDPIWLSFGLNKPGAKARPDAPQNLTVVLIGNNAASVKWNKAPRAEYYRVWKRVVGMEPELLIAGSPADLDFILEGLPSNSFVEIAVSAMNNGGESAKSLLITIQTT